MPRAVDDLERDIKKYDAVAGFHFPDELKLPLLLECLPATHKAELELKYAMGQRDYDKVARDLLTHAKENKFSSSRKDPDAMDLGRLETLAREVEECPARVRA